MDPTEASTHQLPHFVEEYKALLSNKRRMADYTEEELATIFAKNYANFGSESRTDLHSTDREWFELSHLLQVAFNANNGSMWQHQRREFNNVDANGILLYQFAVYLDTFLSEKVSWRFGGVSEEDICVNGRLFHWRGLRRTLYSLSRQGFIEGSLHGRPISHV
ncbi:uncharacterized protein LAESUDRAFT_499004 [Laetiporus sulphureus 93-53]|uniref:Uncharacterized protein n=1 Tax=Laetiporus sulphureus 93-53 TaxID=1314785 RepID=A0A165BHJ3_9APHY|nr:uncharacterized protein LAESUDRAFT_499004 [Laetiporus sulphureus 93-53]KZT01068.1 hypothetical protein LAESUDRAFT_499004 [Laetiporus sulphureus 93-53]